MEVYRSETGRVSVISRQIGFPELAAKVISALTQNQTPLGFHRVLRGAGF